jgi:chromosome segregation ATPase
MQNEISANGTKLQELHYQRTKNDLLAKGQKTSMEISSVVAANGALETDVTNRINTLTNLINNLTEQINNLQQRINQQSNETNEIKIASMQQLGELQLQIAKLQLEKQNMEMYITQIRSNQ